MEDSMKTCRICLKDAEYAVDIFARQKPDESLPYEPEDIPANLIKDCTGLSVQEGDGHHQHLCHPCFKQLRKAFRFKRRYCRSMQSQAPVKREPTDEEISITTNDDAWQPPPPVEVQNEAEIDDDDSTLPVINELESDNTAAEYFEIIETDDLDFNIKTEEDDEEEEEEDEVEEITPNPPRRKRPFTIRVGEVAMEPEPIISVPPPLHYQCIYCPKTFTKEGQLLLHSRSHKKEEADRRERLTGKKAMNILPIECILSQLGAALAIRKEVRCAVAWHPCYAMLQREFRDRKRRVAANANEPTYYFINNERFNNTS